MPQYDLWDESYGFLQKPFSPHLYTFPMGAILLEGKLLSTTEENISRTNKKFSLGIYNNHNDEHTTTFILSIC
jgi:hypothetical protein